MGEIDHYNLSKLHCTFTKKEEVDEIIRNINKKYSILYNKVFVLESPQSEELICTYNIEIGNVSGLMPNTILMHRKRETNTLYTLNALNILIAELNNNQPNLEYVIPWDLYKNCILLITDGKIRKLDTSIYTIVTLE